MSSRKLYYLLTIALTVAVATGLFANRSFSAASKTVSALAKDTHFHGIAFDPSNASRVYLATHHGLYSLAPDGGVTQVSDNRDDFMGFSPHPSDPSVLYASGHPSSGGNLGIIASADGGKSWEKLADGVGGPVDFHQMDTSKADPNTIYGIHRTLQRSTDGGVTWESIGPPPEGVIDLASSSIDADTLFAATQSGILRSADGGRSWKPVHALIRPATMVHVTPSGRIFAFIAETGLVRAKEESLAWQVISNDFGGDFVLHLAADINDDGRLVAVSLNPQSRAQSVLTSTDGGVTWTKLGSE